MYIPKQMKKKKKKNNKKKILFTHISEDKILFAIVSNYCQTFNFMIPLFFLFVFPKAINTVFLLCFNMFLLTALN